MSVSIEMQGYIRKNHRLPSITTKQKGRKTRYRNRIQCFLWLSSAFSFHLCSFCVPLLFFLNKFHRSFWIRFPTPSLATKHETNKKKSEGERERERWTRCTRRCSDALLFPSVFSRNSLFHFHGYSNLWRMFIEIIINRAG